MRICEWCSKPFGDERRANAKTCSRECGDARHADNARKYARERFVKADKLPPKACAKCGGVFVPYRSSSMYCGRRCQWSDHQIAKVPRERPCNRCGVPTPTKPGIPVCDVCKSDKRDSERARIKERRRTLSRYGLTESDFQTMLVAQRSECAICSTSSPGIKGWVVDHCHETDAVRGLLCSQCNLGLGQFRDNPAALREAARYIEHAQWRERSAA